MFSAFSLTLATICLPVLLITLSRARFRERALFLLPFGISLQFGFSIFSAWFLQGMAFGSAKYLLVCLLASVGTAGTLWRWSYFPFRRAGRPSGRWLLLVAFLSFIAIADNALIHARNRWGFEPNAIFPDTKTYLRPPFHNDNQRQVVVVGALLRGGGTPFLPMTEFRYQLGWHHLAAVMVYFYDGLSRHAPVMGVMMATAYLFFFVLFAGMASLRPWRSSPWMMWVPVCLLLPLHSDLLSPLFKWIHEGTLGLQADGSAPAVVGHYFSLKAISLTAPQHLTPLLFLLCAYLARKSLGRRNPQVEWGFLLMAFVASPLLFLFFLPFLCATDVKRWKSWLCLVLVGCLAFRTLAGFFPTEMLFREIGTGESAAWSDWRVWLAIPLLWIGLAGPLGTLVTALLLRTSRRSLRDPLVLALIVGTPAAVLLSPGTEIQRHWAILAALLVALYVAHYLPTSSGWRKGLATSLLVALPLHGYFLFSFLGKPSLIDPKLPWDDYFVMGKILQERFPLLPTLGAKESPNGNYFPPIMEATTSYGGPLDASVHSRLTPSQIALLRKSFVAGILPFGKALGYRALVWGPVEARVWGESARDRFVRSSELLARAGTVSLYRLTDTFELHRGRSALSAPADRLALAEALAKAGWHFEAVELFRSLKQDARALFGAGISLGELGDIVTAAGNLDQALRLGLPENQAIRARRALETFRRALHVAQ